MDKLIKSSFMSKVVYQRLLWKYNISDIDLEERTKLINQYCKMINDSDYNQELLKTIPLTNESFDIMTKVFITYMKDKGLIPIEASYDEIDIKYIEKILESLLYAHKLFLFCTIINPDWNIRKIKELNGIKNPFIKNGYDTILSLAMVYSNTNDSNNQYLKGIGPIKYKELQEFFALNCGIETIEREI